MTPERKRLLFLDLDGVLNSRDFFQRTPQGEGLAVGSAGHLDPAAILRLLAVIEATGCSPPHGGSSTPTSRSRR
jgi:hypothetical protein